VAFSEEGDLVGVSIVAGVRLGSIPWVAEGLCLCAMVGLGQLFG
jgi:hypothetical protein